MTQFYVAVLASGSKGNATLVSYGEQHFLIDMGISCRAVVTKLKEQGIAPEQLAAIFITHEHIDHIRGLETWCKKYQVPIYTSELTWRAILGRFSSLERRSCRVMGKPLEVGALTIESFQIPHDAIDPHGYIFCHEDGHKCTYLTDTGFVTPIVEQAVAGAKVLVLEANHDIEMLKNGPYPYELKQRILSTRGHLSNASAAQLLSKQARLPEIVFLAHLSEENNRPALARETVEQALAEQGRLENMKIYVASQKETVSMQKNLEQDLFAWNR